LIVGEVTAPCCGGTTPDKAFPAGLSPFGCFDLCGNGWQWIESERSDGHPQFCIIGGGSYFAAKGFICCGRATWTLHTGLSGR